MNRVALLSAASLVLAGLSCAAIAQDMVAVAGKQAQVLVENDKVRIIEVTVAPGGSTGMHSHGDNIVVWLTPSDGEQTMADGSKKPLHRKTGEVIWSDPVVHDTVNEGKNTTKVIVIELKNGTATATAGM
jgi:quercetin dioxygenase-like cupin family protein